MHETIAIQPTNPKAKSGKISGDNLNKWVNKLIEAAVGQRTAAWDEFLDQPRRKFKYRSDEVRKADR